MDEMTQMVNMMVDMVDGIFEKLLDPESTTITNVAKLSRKTFVALRDEGFDEHQAMDLMIAMVKKPTK